MKAGSEIKKTQVQVDDLSISHLLDEIELSEYLEPEKAPTTVWKNLTIDDVPGGVDIVNKLSRYFIRKWAMPIEEEKKNDEIISLDLNIPEVKASIDWISIQDSKEE